MVQEQGISAARQLKKSKVPQRMTKNKSTKNKGSLPVSSSNLLDKDSLAIASANKVGLFQGLQNYYES